MAQETIKTGGEFAVRKGFFGTVASRFANLRLRRQPSQAIEAAASVARPGADPILLAAARSMMTASRLNT